MSNHHSTDTSGIPCNIAFEEVEHTADCALKIHGRDLKELLVNAAAGMNSLLSPDPEEFRIEVQKSIALEAADTESLLVEWLGELAFWAETEMLIFHKFDLLSVSSTHLEAKISGRRKTHLEKHIKAVTYHNLEIIQIDEGLTATVVFDV